MPEITRRRIGELQRAVFAVLMNEPEGMNVQEVSKRAEELCPPTEFENEDYPSQPGQRRYPKMLRFATITSVKAGWLVKDKGIWRLTDDGRSAFESYPDPGDFQQAAGAGYSAWKSENKAPTVYDPDEAAEDAEAAGLELGSARSRRAWLVRGANVEGQNMLPKWFADGLCSLAFDLAELPPGTPRHEIAQLAADAYADLHPSARGNAVGIIDRFLNEMAIDDIVVTVNGSKIYVGIIAGGAEYAADTSTRMRRAVSWQNFDDPFARSSLSSDAADALRGQLTVSDLTQFLSEFARRGGIELDAVEETARSVDEIEVQLLMPDAALADALLLPVEWLRETVDLLNDKRQIVLYGPPGTGKTYLAQELCKALVENSDGEYTVVQFHPSYAYEDFFEGLRPWIAQDGSGAVFQPGSGTAASHGQARCREFNPSIRPDHRRDQSSQPGEGVRRVVLPSRISRSGCRSAVLRRPIPAASQFASFADVRTVRYSSGIPFVIGVSDLREHRRIIEQAAGRLAATSANEYGFPRTDSDVHRLPGCVVVGSIDVHGRRWRCGVDGASAAEPVP